MSKLKYNTINVGERYESNSYGTYTVLEKLVKSHMRIRFDKTGHEREYLISALKRGKVRDPYYPIYYGVGFLGEGPYVAFKNGRRTKCNDVWLSMIIRCYSNKQNYVRNYKDRGVIVCREWHNFQNFAPWFFENYRDGQHLDKDLFGKDSMQYSPETCCFLPAQMNALLGTKSGVYKPGVNKGERGGYSVRMSKKETGNEYYGTYPTETEAFGVYKAIKEDYIKELALHYYKNEQIPKSVCDALCNWEVGYDG